MRGTSSLPSLVPAGYMSFCPFFGLPCDDSDHQILLDFLPTLLEVSQNEVMSSASDIKLSPIF